MVKLLKINHREHRVKVLLFVFFSVLSVCSVVGPIKNMKPKRLSKALAAAGIASRRASEEIIFAGRVKVNGEIVLIPQTFIDWEKDQITLDNVRVLGEETKQYFMLNKPFGMICSQEIVMDLFAGHSGHFFSVGRLDREAMGLLLITNDGHFADHVLRASSNITKEYVVKVLNEITPDHLETLSQGAKIDDHWVRPLSVAKSAPWYF